MHLIFTEESSVISEADWTKQPWDGKETGVQRSQGQVYWTLTDTVPAGYEAVETHDWTVRVRGGELLQVPCYMSPVFRRTWLRALPTAGKLKFSLLGLVSYQVRSEAKPFDIYAELNRVTYPDKTPPAPEAVPQGFVDAIFVVNRKRNADLDALDATRSRAVAEADIKLNRAGLGSVYNALNGGGASRPVRIPKGKRRPLLKHAESLRAAELAKLAGYGRVQSEWRKAITATAAEWNQPVPPLTARPGARVNWHEPAILNASGVPTGPARIVAF